MPEWASTIIVAAVLLLILFGMWRGWRANVRRSAHLVPSREIPAGLGAAVAEARVLYVATTAQGQPLERLAIAGLGFRAQGTLAAYGTGVLIALDGSEDVWVPASVIIGAGPAQVAIDKAVEKDGLFLLGWKIGATSVESYFRVLEPEKSGSLYDAIDAIIAGGTEAQAAPAPQPPAYESEV